MNVHRKQLLVMLKEAQLRSVTHEYELGIDLIGPSEWGVVSGRECC